MTSDRNAEYTRLRRVRNDSAAPTMSAAAPVSVIESSTAELPELRPRRRSKESARRPRRWRTTRARLGWAIRARRGQCRVPRGHGCRARSPGRPSSSRRVLARCRRRSPASDRSLRARGAPRQDSSRSRRVPRRVRTRTPRVANASRCTRRRPSKTNRRTVPRVLPAARSPLRGALRRCRARVKRSRRGRR